MAVTPVRSDRFSLSVLLVAFLLTFAVYHKNGDASDIGSRVSSLALVGEVATMTPRTLYIDSTCPFSGDGNAMACASADGASGALNALTALESVPGGILPDTSILLKRGTVYREMLVIPASGTAGHPIRVSSFGEGAQPVILGSDIVADWTPGSDSVYSAKVSWVPHMVFEKDVPLKAATARAAMTKGSFFYDSVSQILSVWPAASFASSSIEIAHRPQDYYGLVMDGWTGNSYIDFDGITVKNSNWMSFRIFGGTNVTVRNCTIVNGFYNGIIAMGTGQGAAHDPDGLAIRSNTISNHGHARARGYDGAAGISVDGADSFAITGNTIATNYGEGIETYNSATRGDISGNTVRNQQISGAIYVNASHGFTTSNILVHDNVISGGSSTAHVALIAAIEGTGTIDAIQMYRNSITGYPAGGGLVVGSGSGSITNSKFFSNTIKNTLHGIEVIGSTGLVFKNNTFLRNSVTLTRKGSLLLVTKGGNVGNSFDYNTYVDSALAKPFFWLGAYYTLPALQKASGQELRSRLN